MRSIVSTLTLGAVLALSFAPSLVDGGGHCLGHNLEPTFNRPLTEEPGHGVHHTDCVWLRGTSDARAMLVPAQSLVGLAPYGPSALLSIHMNNSAEVVASTGRAPPVSC